MLICGFLKKSWWGSQFFFYLRIFKIGLGKNTFIKIFRFKIQNKHKFKLVYVLKVTGSKKPLNEQSDLCFICSSLAMWQLDLCQRLWFLYLNHSSQSGYNFTWDCCKEKIINIIFLKIIFHSITLTWITKTVKLC